MNNGKYIFSQLVEFLPNRVFDSLVQKYQGNKYVKHFTCWNQLLVMIFGQLTNRESLRDLVVVLNAHTPKNYHLGFGRSITRSNLSKANESRDYHIFEEFAYHLIDIARKKLQNDDFEIKGQIYAFDSTTIDLCLNVFWWAKFKKTKGGIKLHTLYDVNTHIPAFIHISEASVNDVNAMDFISYEIGAYYIFDRGYIDFERLFRITQFDSYFVIRSRKRLRFSCSSDRPIDKKTGVISDQEGTLSGFYPAKYYPSKLRRVVYFDAEMSRTFIFLTNNFELPPEQIALLYRKRWQIELFFKWIKQHLKIKSFWGTSENGVRIQIYSAIISYCLVAIVGHDHKLNRSTYEILTVLGVSLLDKTPINVLFNNLYSNDVKEQNQNQLSLTF